MANEESQAVEVTATAQAPSLYEQFHATMLREAQQNAEREDVAQEVMESQLAAILGAKTREELWRADMGGTVQARDAHGLEVRITAMRADVSDRDDLDNTHGYYISYPDTVVLGGPADILTKNGLVVGQVFVLQTGAELFNAKLAMFRADNAFPIDGVIGATKTRSGNHVIKFWEMPVRTQPS
jgi:hypothetical protein